MSSGRPLGVAQTLSLPGPALLPGQTPARHRAAARKLRLLPIVFQAFCELVRARIIVSLRAFLPARALQTRALSHALPSQAVPSHAVPSHDLPILDLPIHDVPSRDRKGAVPNGAAPKAALLAWAIRRAAPFVPRSTCLVRAIAAQRLLARYGHDATIHIGVARPADSEFEAHAWVEYNGEILVGRTATQYTPLLNWSTAR